jgi:hypothetical protein
MEAIMRTGIKEFQERIAEAEAWGNTEAAKLARWRLEWVRKRNASKKQGGRAA